MEPMQVRVCQCQCIPKLSLGTIAVQPPSFAGWLKLMLKRHLGDSTKRTLKRRSSLLIQSLKLTRRRSDATLTDTDSATGGLASGCMVRVRPEEEIGATLNAWSELKGCMFMDAQRQYCGTTQRVLKLVERFVDERDYRVKKAKGLVLLEGLFCEGTPDYGRCDRACHYFWREEWLERLDDLTMRDMGHQEASETRQVPSQEESQRGT